MKSARTAKKSKKPAAANASVLGDLPGREKIKTPRNHVSKKPVVSVCVMTYNHQKYIAQCLDGILRQKTDFDFEILLGEDDSSDATRKICIEYAERYPDKIRLFLHDRSNVIEIGGRPSGRYNLLHNLQAARGKYVALCEGDDYWTDPTKLQRQVDFMEKHPDYSLCFHPVKITVDGTKKSETYPKERDPAKFTTSELLKANFIQTCSIMYRRQDYTKLPASATRIMPGDWFLHLYHAQFGKIGFIDKTMAVYRRHSQGLWWGSYSDMDATWRRYGLNWLELYIEALNLYGKNIQYRESLEGSIITSFNVLARIDRTHGDALLPEALAAFPEQATLFINDLRKQIRGLDTHSKKQADIIKHHVSLSQHLESQNDRLTNENERLRQKILIRLEGTVKKVVKKRIGRKDSR